jgi:predicted phage terminase large subunit-like protein
MDDLLEEKAKLLGSLLLFTQVFYKIRTGRDFVLSKPVARESHYITICRELTKVLRLETLNLLINVPPGHGKSELLIHFVAWAMAHFPDSQFLYISYSHEIAAKHTYTIKQIMELPLYKRLFNVEIRHDSSAKDNFKTLQGGSIKAFGSSGSITGQDAGLPNLTRFSGCTIMDDMHKPDEVFSDTRRETVKNNYDNTILRRLRGPLVPQIGIGQCLHEDDLMMNLRAGWDGREWRNVVLEARDGAGNILAPNLTPKDMLDNMDDQSPYVYAAQYQQNPMPAGGGIFKRDWFVKLDDEPDILATFITADTAETDKTYNDPSVFSFWGLYKIHAFGADTDVYGLHWLDCVEQWLEPKDLEDAFAEFYADCLRYPVQPNLAGIEKKSTGVTLSSILKTKRGLTILDIERTRASGSKTARFLEIQPFVASQRISLPANAKHTELCIRHCEKITANDTHRHDDIADTLYDAVKLGLIDKIVMPSVVREQEEQNIINKLLLTQRKLQLQKGRAYGKNG